MNFLFTYGPCANSLSFFTISESLKFHGRKNFEGPSASMSLLMRRMYSFMLGEAVRNFHRFIVASSGRCGNFLMISFRSSSVRYNTAGSHPCTGCLLAPANCTLLSKKQKVCSNKTNSSSPLGCSALISAGPPACDSILLVLTQQSFCVNELSSCVYIIVIVTRKVIRHVVDVSSPGAAGCTGRWILEMQLEDPRGKVKMGSAPSQFTGRCRSFSSTNGSSKLGRKILEVPFTNHCWSSASSANGRFAVQDHSFFSIPLPHRWKPLDNFNIFLFGRCFNLEIYGLV